MRLLGAIDVNIGGFFARLGKYANLIIFGIQKTAADGVIFFVPVGMNQTHFSDLYRGNKGSVIFKDLESAADARRGNADNVAVKNHLLRRDNFNMKSLFHSIPVLIG